MRECVELRRFGQEREMLRVEGRREWVRAVEMRAIELVVRGHASSEEVELCGVVEEIAADVAVQGLVETEREEHEVGGSFQRGALLDTVRAVLERLDELRADRVVGEALAVPFAGRVRLVVPCV